MTMDRGDATLPLRVGPEGPPSIPGEPADLAAVAAAGLVVAPAVWVPAAAEQAFYALNRLPPRLAELFDGVDPFDPDEDDVEERSPLARALLARHVLLDTWIDAFYDRLEGLPSSVRVRRPDSEGRVCARGRPALLALRATWADAWHDDEVLARLRASGSVAVEAGPVLVQDADDAPAPHVLASRVEEILGVSREVYALADGSITRVGSATRRRWPEPER